MTSNGRPDGVDAGSAEHELTSLVDALREGSSSANAGTAARLLIQRNDDETDAALLALFDESGTDVASLASRILAERDPDRDPAYAVDYLSNAEHRMRRVPLFGRIVPNMPYAFPWTCTHGVSRLRRADPVRHYSDLLGDRRARERCNAAAALGDTADVTALDALERGLADRHWRVRRVAADSVRRLRHFGAGDALPQHRARSQLVTRLGDSREAVALAAARALWSVGDESPVREAWENLGHRRAVFEPVLNGDIPPLYPIWAADDAL